MPSGIFFSLDGIDGGGKSTQMTMFCEWLLEQQREVVTCRDPGSTKLGEAIRGMLLDRSDMAIGRMSEMLLYMASRAQLVEELIVPALARDAIVVSDRYLLANIVYQAHAGGLSEQETWEIGRIATRGLLPHLTFVLDLDVNIAWSRIGRERGHHDRIESQGLEYLGRVREGFLTEAARFPDQIKVLDATLPREEIQSQMRAAAQRFLSVLRT